MKACMRYLKMKQCMKIKNMLDTSKLTLQQKLSIEYIEDVEKNDDDVATREIKDYLRSERMAKERKERTEEENKK